MRNFLPMPVSTLRTDAAQEGEALKNTRDACTLVLGLCRESDLPASAFEVVMQTYHGQLVAIAHRDAEAHEKKIANQMNAILARRPRNVGGLDDDYVVPNYVRPMLGQRDPYEQKLIAMSEAELEAEYQRVVVDASPASQKP